MAGEPSGKEYMLQLLEALILKEIGELPAEREAAIKLLEPWLNVTFRNVGPWDTSLKQAMRLPASFSQSMRDHYRSYLLFCESHGVKPSASEFSKNVIQSNFADKI